MKANTMFWSVVVAAAIATSALAQNGAKEIAYFSDIVTIQKADYSKLEKKYASTLSSENLGVVESGLAHIAMFKLMYPVKEFSVLEQAVKDVAAKNPSPEIRYKAYLVMSLFKNPAQFASQACSNYNSPDDLFGALATRIHDVIVSNETK
jgi:hypothetical protein